MKFTVLMEVNKIAIGILMATLLSTSRVCPAQPAPLSLYRITPLEKMGQGIALNNRGQVAGWGNPTEMLNSEQGDPALVWDKGHIIVLFDGVATGLNNRGEVVGHFSANEPYKLAAYQVPYSLYELPFLWDAHNGLRSLLDPIKTGIYRSAAVAINDHAQIVGNIPNEGFCWQNGTLTRLPAFSEVSAINNHSQIVGHHFGDVLVAHLDKHGNLGPPTLLPTLPGSQGTNARAINENRDIVGFAIMKVIEVTDYKITSKYPLRRALLWRGGRLVDLGELAGFTDFDARGINRKGLIVGTAKNPERNTSTAFLWSRGKMIDLNTLLPENSGWILHEALAINDPGQILCLGSHGYCLLEPK